MGSLWVPSLQRVPASPELAHPLEPQLTERQAADTWKALVGQHSSLPLQEQRRWLPKVNGTSRAYGQHQWAALKQSNTAPSGRTPAPEHQCLTLTVTIPWLNDFESPLTNNISRVLLSVIGALA